MKLNFSLVLIIISSIITYSIDRSGSVTGNKKNIQPIVKAAGSIIDSIQFIDTSGADSMLEPLPDTDTIAGISAKEIVDNYIIALGGKDKLYNIIDRTTIMRGSVQGFDISLTIYQKAPNKRKQITKVGDSEQLLIYDGIRGVAVTGGKEEEIKGLELEKLKYESTIALLPELEYYGITLNLEGIETVDSIKTYKIVMTLPSGIKWAQYYNTVNHLKEKESKYVKTPAGLFEQEIWFKDYQEVEGIKYPFTIKQKLGNQTMDFTVTSIKVNTGLAEREFEID